MVFALRQHRGLKGLYWKSIGMISEMGKLSHRAMPTTWGQGKTAVGLLPAWQSDDMVFKALGSVPPSLAKG